MICGKEERGKKMMHFPRQRKEQNRLSWSYKWKAVTYHSTQTVYLMWFVSSNALCIKPVSQSEFTRQQEQPQSTKNLSLCCLESLNLSGEWALFYKRSWVIMLSVPIKTQNIWTGSRTEGDVAIQKFKKLISILQTLTRLEEKSLRQKGFQRKVPPAHSLTKNFSSERRNRQQSSHRLCSYRYLELETSSSLSIVNWILKLIKQSYTSLL